MANKYYNKVVYGGKTLIDLTGDTITADKLASGIKAHDKSGAEITGTNTYDADTSDATAAASEILNTKTAYVNGSKVTGTMPNRGAVTGTITTKAGQYTIQQGYHDGSGKVGISSTEQNKIVAKNIKKGISILGVTGSYTGDDQITATPLTATPYTTAKTYTPTDTASLYDYFSEVTVNAIAYTETDNSAGGITVTIGTVDPDAA